MYVVCPSTHSLITFMCILQKLGNSEMLGHIANVRQALRFAVSDFHGDELPGFCLPGKVRISKMCERN